MDRLKRFLPLIALAGVVALIFGMGWNRYLSLDTLREHGQALRGFAADNYLLSLLALMAVFAVLTASVVPGVFFVTITAGYLFGPWVGGVSTSVAATAGALIVYGEMPPQRDGRAVHDPSFDSRLQAFTFVHGRRDSRKNQRDQRFSAESAFHPAPGLSRYPRSHSSSSSSSKSSSARSSSVSSSSLGSNGGSFGS